MSDVLIKNMMMPKGDVPLVLIIASDGTVEEIDDSDEINETEARAIEIPPHGRLTDADELYKIVNAMDKCSMSKVLEYILDAPTILEASNKTETPKKARICPHYQGVCGLDEDIVCYCSSSYEMCDKYREASK